MHRNQLEFHHRFGLFACFSLVWVHSRSPAFTSFHCLSESMKPFFVGIQLSVIVSVVIFSYFLGPPIYGELAARIKALGVGDVGPGATGSAPLANELDNGRKESNFKDKDPQGDLTKENSAESEVGRTDAKQRAGSATPAVDEIKLDADRKGDNENKKNSGSQTSQYVHSDYEYLLRKPIWEKPLTGGTVPPLEMFKLTEEMVASRAINNVIVVTFANYAFLDFVLTWVRHLTELNVFNILVGAMDTQILEALFWDGVPVFDMGSKMNSKDVGWGTPTFHKMGREKVILVNQFLSMGYELLMCDTDMVWIKNPLPYLARYPGADVLVSSDEVASSVNDDRLEVWERAQGAYNIGIFYWRPSQIAKLFAREWLEQLIADDKIWDQNGFNELMRRKRGPAVENGSGLFYAYDGNLELGVLPVSIFCSGHTYFVQALYEQLELKPYAVHTTFQFAGTPGKRHRLREAKLFYDRPEYYDTPGGFLSVQHSIPEELLTSGDHSVENHFNLINYQMKQIRGALAVASILNRTLVMPPLWCRLDRLWFGHPGVLPGTKTKQPFLCPLDHVLEVNVMLQDVDEELYGPAIWFREYSFLNNSRLPNQVKESKMEVILCKRDSAGCGEEVEGLPRRFKLPKNSTENEILAALSRYDDIKVFEFSSIADAFNGFTDKKRDVKFRARVKRYTGIWCCVQNRHIGHIYYDMYWDEKPDWRPLPPANREDDHPPW